SRRTVGASKVAVFGVTGAGRGIDDTVAAQRSEGYGREVTVEGDVAAVQAGIVLGTATGIIPAIDTHAHRRFTSVICSCVGKGQPRERQAMVDYRAVADGENGC